MRSGLHFVEDYVDDQTSNCIEMLFGGTDPSHAAYAAAQPLDHPPGEVWSYSSGTTNILCRIVGDVLTGASGGDPAARRQAVERYLAERLFGPVGMTSAIPKFDDAGDFVGSSYVYATARDFARFGELYRHDGVTDSGSGARILPEGWLDHARTKVAHDPEQRIRLRPSLVDVAAVPGQPVVPRLPGAVHDRRARQGARGRPPRAHPGRGRAGVAAPPELTSSRRTDRYG